jgi:small-conductance mechanosensitive channel
MFELKNAGFVTRIILRALRIPAVIFIIGTALLALSSIDKIFPLIKEKRVFLFTDNFANFLISIALALFIYRFLVLLCRRYEFKLVDQHKIAALILSAISKSLRVILILAIFNIFITFAAPSNFYSGLLQNIFYIVIIASIGWIAIQILYMIEALLYERIGRVSAKEHGRAKALYTKMHILKNIATVIIVIITMAAILMSFHNVRSIGISLLASAGFLTAIIGLAAQKPLYSLFSGLQIALAQPIKIGDVVLLEEETGTVEEITFSYVIVKLSDRRRIVVPISYFNEKPFQSWTRAAESLRTSFKMYVDYMMPIEPLRQAFDNLLKTSPYWDTCYSKLYVSDITKKAIEITLSMSAANHDNLSELRAEMRENIITFMRENYPHYFPFARYHQCT